MGGEEAFGEGRFHHFTVSSNPFLQGAVVRTLHAPSGFEYHEGTCWWGLLRFGRLEDEGLEYKRFEASIVYIVRRMTLPLPLSLSQGNGKNSKERETGEKNWRHGDTVKRMYGGRKERGDK